MSGLKHRDSLRESVSELTAQHSLMEQRVNDHDRLERTAHAMQGFIRAHPTIVTPARIIDNYGTQQIEPASETWPFKGEL